MGPVQRRQRIHVPLAHRRPLPQDLPRIDSEHVQASIPSLCSHLLPPLPGRHRAWFGAASQHELQALRPIHRRAWLSKREQGLLGALGRLGREYVEERLGDRDCHSKSTRGRVGSFGNSIFHGV